MRNIFKISFRDKQQQTEEVFESWVVRWTTVEYTSWCIYADKKEMVRAFTTKRGAEEFVKALEDAWDLLKADRFPIKIERSTD